MATKKGAEAIALALANTATLHLNAEIDAVKSAWNDTIPLPYPKKIFSEDRMEIPDYPAFIISMRGGHQTANGAYSAAAGWAQQQHEFFATLLIKGDKLEVLERQARRYSVAIWELYMKYQGLDDSVPGQTGVDLLEWTYNPIADAAQNRLLMIYAIGWRGLVYVTQDV